MVFGLRKLPELELEELDELDELLTEPEELMDPPLLPLSDELALFDWSKAMASLSHCVGFDYQCGALAAKKCKNPKKNLEVYSARATRTVPQTGSNITARCVQSCPAFGHCRLAPLGPSTEPSTFKMNWSVSARRCESFRGRRFGSAKSMRRTASSLRRDMVVGRENQNRHRRIACDYRARHVAEGKVSSLPTGHIGSGRGVARGRRNQWLDARVCPVLARCLTGSLWG